MSVQREPPVHPVGDPASFMDVTFPELDEVALNALVAHGAVRMFPKNMIVIAEGDVTDSLYVVVSGRVKVFLLGEDGREKVLSMVGPGQLFGEVTLDGGARSASVVTTEPSRLFVIARTDVDALLDCNPAFAKLLIHQLTSRVRSLTGQVADLALKNVYGRFVGFLNEHAEVDGDARVVNERLTQRDIAARIGGSREMVSRVIKDLVVGGYISVDAKRITIHRRLPASW